MSRVPLVAGYLPLVDCAPMVLAKELGYAREEGLDLTLSREPTWSMIRDKLSFGQLDAAVMLSPMPIAMSMGLGSLAEEIDVIAVSSVNGNVIGARAEIAARMADLGAPNGFEHPAETGAALAQIDGPLRIGVPFPFSMHKELILYWLTSCGITEERLEICTVPPPLMADAVASNAIDLFCVGEPWGSVTAEQTGAHLLLPGAAIWSFAPEKVLSMRRDWLSENSAVAAALFRATWRAAAWLAEPGNSATAADILSRPDYVGVSSEILDRAFTGRLAVTPNGGQIVTPRFLGFFDSCARFPWRSQAKWIALRLAQRHGLDPGKALTIAEQCFRTDLFRKFAAPLDVDLPGASEKVEGMLAEPTAVGSAKGKMILGPDVFFDGRTFDPLFIR